MVVFLRKFNDMANNYIQIFLHLVFAVKNRDSFIPTVYQSKIHSYMASTLRNFGHIPYKIGGTETHVHILLGYDISQPVSDLVRDLKVATTKFINESHIIPFQFSWQRGYGCFSASPSHKEQLCHYIEHQYEHHKGVSLADEMKRILDKYSISFDEKYILSDPV